MTMLNTFSPTRRVPPLADSDASSGQTKKIRRRSTIGRLQRLLVSLLLTTTVGVGLLAAPTPASAHGQNANGCTGVPDSGYGFSFHGQCDRHDQCYGAKPYGTDSAGRRQCDRVFRSEMLGYCDRHSTLSVKGVLCRSVAKAYYGGVRALGHPFWARSSPTPIA